MLSNPRQKSEETPDRDISDSRWRIEIHSEIRILIGHGREILKTFPSMHSLPNPPQSFDSLNLHEIETERKIHSSVFQDLTLKRETRELLQKLGNFKTIL